MEKTNNQTKAKTNPKKVVEINVVNKGNLQFKSFSGKRNNSKMVIVRPK